jgi:hypothetical protein
MFEELVKEKGSVSSLQSCYEGTCLLISQAGKSIFKREKREKQIKKKCRERTQVVADRGEDDGMPSADLILDAIRHVLMDHAEEHQSVEKVMDFMVCLSKGRVFIDQQFELIPLVLNTMERYGGNTLVMGAALRAIGSMAITEEAAEMLLNSDIKALNRVKNTLQAYMNSHEGMNENDILGNGLNIFARLSALSMCYAQLVVSNDAIPFIGRVLERYSSSEKRMEKYALETLRNILVFLPERAGEIAHEAGIITILVSITSYSIFRHQLFRIGTELIKLLAENSEFGANLLASQSTIEIFDRIMTEKNDDEHLLEHMCIAFGRIAPFVRPFQLEFEVHPAIRLMSCINLHSENSAIVAHGLKAVQFMASIDEKRCASLLFSEHNITLLVVILQVIINDSDAISDVCSILAIVADLDDDAIKLMIECRLMRRISDVLHKNESNRQVLDAICKLVSRFTPKFASSIPDAIQDIMHCDPS